MVDLGDGLKLKGIFTAKSNPAEVIRKIANEMTFLYFLLSQKVAEHRKHVWSFHPGGLVNSPMFKGLDSSRARKFKLYKSHILDTFFIMAKKGYIWDFD